MTVSPPGPPSSAACARPRGPRAALTVVSGPIAAAGEDADAARDIVATCVAWYLGAMGDLYRQAVSGQGYAAEVRAILAANPRPSPRHGTVPPAAEVILDQLTAYGTSDQVRQRLSALGPGRRHHHAPPAARPVLGRHRGHPAGRGTG